MKNLLSPQQMIEWNHFEKTVDDAEEELVMINDYYECLIECLEDQASCKRICKYILT